MTYKKTAVLLAFLLLCSCMLLPMRACAEETTEESVFSVLDEEELTAGIESIITSFHRDKKTVSVALCFPATGELYYYNADRWWYTASLFKLPLVMKISNMQMNGEIDYNKVKISTDLDTALKKVLVYSDNSWAYGLQEKVFDDDLAAIRANDLAYSTDFDAQDLPKKFYTSYLYSARFYLGILRELYAHPEEYPHVLEYMKEASPTKYFHRVLEDRYEIAQKYGSAGHVCHAGGVIYTPDPVLLVVMNSGVEDLPGNKMIGEISAYIAACAEEWHLDLEEQKKQAEEKARVEAKAKAAEPLAPVTEKPQEEPALSVIQVQPEDTEKNEHPAAGIVLLAAAAIAVLILLAFRMRKKLLLHPETETGTNGEETDSLPGENGSPEDDEELLWEQEEYPEIDPDRYRETEDEADEEADTDEEPSDDPDEPLI